MHGEVTRYDVGLAIYFLEGCALESQCRISGRVKEVASFEVVVSGFHTRVDAVYVRRKFYHGVRHIVFGRGNCRRETFETTLNGADTIVGNTPIELRMHSVKFPGLCEYVQHIEKARGPNR